MHASAIAPVSFKKDSTPKASNISSGGVGCSLMNSIDREELVNFGGAISSGGVGCTVMNSLEQDELVDFGGAISSGGVGCTVM